MEDTIAYGKAEAEYFSTRRTVKDTPSLSQPVGADDNIESTFLRVQSDWYDVPRTMAEKPMTCWTKP
jgi:hypothetical protein